MRRLHICHTTTYTYSQAVDLLPHTMMVRPREGHDLSQPATMQVGVQVTEIN